MNLEQYCNCSTDRFSFITFSLPSPSPIAFQPTGFPALLPFTFYLYPLTFSLSPCPSEHQKVIILWASPRPSRILKISHRPFASLIRGTEYAELLIFYSLSAESRFIIPAKGIIYSNMRPGISSASMRRSIAVVRDIIPKLITIVVNRNCSALRFKSKSLLDIFNKGFAAYSNTFRPM